MPWNLFPRPSLQVSGEQLAGDVGIPPNEPLLTLEATRWRAIGQILLLTAGLLVLIGISALSVVLVNQARKDNAWVVHTVEVENQINSLLLQVRRAESASRGYLLTSEPRFLADYEIAFAAVTPDVDKLTVLSQDNPVQVEKQQSAA